MRRLGFLKDLAVLALLGAGLWYGYRHWEPEIRALLGLPQPKVVRLLPDQFACEPRRFCSQLRSCDEARWVARYCEPLKMEGEFDGRTCEQRWCGGS